MRRVHCRSPGAPLEHRFAAPDDIFSLGEQEKARAKVQRDFASLDGQRFFVRCLLPVPVEHYGPWHVGLWVEVPATDAPRILQAWDDPKLYGALRFSGTIANDLGGGVDLPVAVGTEVVVHAPEPDALPQIVCEALFPKAWPRAEFEQYAVGRGFL